MILRPIRLVALTVLLLLAVYYALVHRCDAGGAMAGAYQECNCFGFEWLMYDKQAADGPRRSVCLGWVLERTCHANRGAPPTPCP